MDVHIVNNLYKSVDYMSPQNFTYYILTLAGHSSPMVLIVSIFCKSWFYSKLGPMMFIWFLCVTIINVFQFFWVWSTSVVCFFYTVVQTSCSQQAFPGTFKFRHSFLRVPRKQTDAFIPDFCLIFIRNFTIHVRFIVGMSLAFIITYSTSYII